MTDFLPAVLRLSGVLASLFAALLFDLRGRRIPNGLSLLTAAAGILWWLAAHEPAGVKPALLGLLTGFALLLPGYALLGLGAGDVKFVGALGAFLGPWPTFIAVLATFLFGLVLGLGLVIARGHLPRLLRRYRQALAGLLSAEWRYAPPAPDEAAAMRIPLAPAIFLGTIFSLWYCRADLGFAGLIPANAIFG